jgi:hypothetical protein
MSNFYNKNRGDLPRASTWRQRGGNPNVEFLQERQFIPSIAMRQGVCVNPNEE